ncbi:MAG: MotA/TolQ/ExbB proton channel family protein [Polyangiales bacterium]|nr:MotA/TolQ/ExbB proton channel family protein [Myxococcales bacterium]MCB9660173.1 MotA/TolQ/ExbB proton channel family protein [Sandaracinaceae bacterium]
MDVVNETKSLLLAMGASPIMWFMIFLSLASITVMVERAWFFHSITEDIELIARRLSALLDARDYEGARALMRSSSSAEAAVVLAGLLDAGRGVRAAREAMAGAEALQRKRLERRLGYLGTLGSNAPFVGLFGTVVGVVMAFEELGVGDGSTANAAVMASIAEALVATAIGLAVAIPAIAAYNGFQRRIKGIAYDTDALAHVLLAHLEGEAGASEVPRDALPQRAPRARDTPDTEELGRVRASLVEVS